MALTIRVLRGYEEQDRKYRLLVSLVRSDRPKYYTFHCLFCQQPLVELNGREVVSITDFYNREDASNGGVGLRCPSVNCHGRWYFFQMN